MSEAKNYAGSCHCGKVNYKVSIDLKQVMTCNCSICSRTGSMMAFVPSQNFQLLSGESDLTDYQFNKHIIHHVFCSTCGVRSFARGTDARGGETCMINVRCLAGVDLKALPVQEHDGKSM